MPKRYLLFAGQDYEEAGGWHDLLETFSNLKEAVKYAKSHQNTWIKNSWEMDWWHIVDTKSLTIVKESDLSGRRNDES
jgi:tRNA A37 N6-isopentenylltransferase MiaA